MQIGHGSQLIASVHVHMLTFSNMLQNILCWSLARVTARTKSIPVWQTATAPQAVAAGSVCVCARVDL